jgi:hypothetical protein
MKKTSLLNPGAKAQLYFPSSSVNGCAKAHGVMVSNPSFSPDHAWVNKRDVIPSPVLSSVKRSN